MRVVGKVVGVGGFPAEGAIEGQRSTDRGLKTGEGGSLFFCAQFAWVKVGWGRFGHGGEM